MFRVRFHVFKCQVRVERASLQTFQRRSNDPRSIVHGLRVGDCFGKANFPTLDNAFDKYYYRKHKTERDK